MNNSKKYSRLMSIAIAIAMVFSVMVFMPEDVSAASKKPGKVKITKAVKLNRMITVTWKKTKGAKKYQIYIKQGKKKWKKVATVKANGKAKQTYKIKKLKWNTKYQVKMRAVNGKKKGRWSSRWGGKLAKKTTLQKEINKSAEAKRMLRNMEKQLSRSDVTVKVSASGNTLIITSTLVGAENDFTGYINEVKEYYDKDLQSSSMKKDRKSAIKILEEGTGIFGIAIRDKVYDSAGNFITSYTYK